MDFKKHFDEIVKLLAPHQPLWYEEVLNFYPRALDKYPHHWVEQLSQLTKRELWRLDGKKDWSALPKGELKDLIQSIQDIIKLPKITPEASNIPLWNFTNVKGKKNHEIKTLFPIIKKLNQEYSFSHAIDIGGGVGHLARTIAHHGNLPCTSIDRNKKFQEIGIKRAQKYPIPEEAMPLNFINMTFGEEAKELQDLFSSQALTLGLHTCGPLANNHIQANINNKTKGLLNFGCCYANLNPDKDLNLSKYAKMSGVSMTTHTLTLATRGHTEMSYEEFLLKERVKRWRYTFHLLLYEKMNIRTFISAGEAPRKIYWESFSCYAKNRFKHLELECSLSDVELDDFASNQEISDKVRWMFLANIIRWQFGRLIEHYILTDRCLYLTENDHKVEMKEFFDETISPRNIGILAINQSC